MAEIQEATQTEVTAPPIKVRLYAAEKKGHVPWKKLADKAAGVVITAGGIGIIASIIAILFVIVAETLPLWKSPIAEQGKTITLNLAEGEGLQSSRTGEAIAPPQLANKTLALGVDDQQEIAYLVTTAGTIDFLSL